MCPADGIFAYIFRNSADFLKLVNTPDIKIDLGNQTIPKSV